MEGGVLVLLLMTLLGSLYQCQSARANESGVPVGTVKTIKDVEYGVLIDCIDIYKQRSLRHPLLKNHTIQMKPSYPLGKEEAKPKGEHFDQPWSKYGECPEGTIPVIRTRRRLARTNEARVPGIIVNRNRNDYMHGLECAHVFETVKKYTGIHAHLNLWRPAVEADGQSSARLWLMSSDKSDDIDIISAGWMVDPNWVYPNKTVSIIFWMNNQHQTRGCYNLQCRGFVQTSHTFTLGSPFHRVSTYGGTQYATQFTIRKDYMTGNWWLRMMNADLGYWPSTLFTILKGSAEYIVWGGHVTSESGVPGMKHTRTQMGSGHFPNEGFGKACYFRNLSYTTVDTPRLEPPNVKDLHMYVTKPNCYDMKLAEDEQWGVHTYFGGPGFSKKCQRY